MYLILSYDIFAIIFFNMIQIYYKYTVIQIYYKYTVIKISIDLIKIQLTSCVINIILFYMKYYKYKDYNEMYMHVI